jgi:RNA polymerase sigma factor (sigma-70 family)
MLVDRYAPTDDAATFADWVEPHVAAMSRLAARLAPDSDRDDIVQEALVRAWRKRAQFDPNRGTASAWLLAITADQARQSRRRSNRRVLSAMVRSDAHPIGEQDQQLDLERSVARLPARQRLAVECFYFSGLPVADTAAVMRCSEGTVKSTLSDARANLRQLLEETQ